MTLLQQLKLNIVLSACFMRNASKLNCELNFLSSLGSHAPQLQNVINVESSSWQH